ncbi:MAG: hypothetical protein EXQ52_16255 [Bryobacterales bacterium]|nr:hypothetical protein [Bryobacterales bacterium]
MNAIRVVGPLAMQSRSSKLATACATPISLTTVLSSAVWVNCANTPSVPKAALAVALPATPPFGRLSNPVQLDTIVPSFWHSGSPSNATSGVDLSAAARTCPANAKEATNGSRILMPRRTKPRAGLDLGA